MFAVRKAVWPAALMIAVLLTMAAPAAARPGIWIVVPDGKTVGITLINLTDQTLTINSPNNWDVYNAGCMPANLGQSYPFQNQGKLNLAPYRTATWRSQDCQTGFHTAWAGELDVWAGDYSNPEVAVWGVRLMAEIEKAKGFALDDKKGTWFYLVPLNDVWWNSAEGRGWDEFAYGIWATPVASSETYYNHMLNVMTLSGEKYAVSLYNSGGESNRRIALVFRETHWDGTKVDDYVGWPLHFTDNEGDNVPDRK